MSVIISDDCTGANGNDVNGRTPDTTNTPGNTYVSTANTFETDGSGNFKTSGAGTSARINTGVTDQKFTIVWNANSGNNRVGLFVRCTNAVPGGGTFDAINVLIETDLDQFRVFTTVNGTSTQLGSTTAYGAFDTSSDFTIAMQSQGSTHKVYVAGVEQFSQSDATVDGVTEGGSYILLFHGAYAGTGGRVRSLEVDNLVTAIPRQLINSGLVNYSPLLSGLVG